MGLIDALLPYRTAKAAPIDATRVLDERYPEVKAAGNILNLWPAPQKALRVLGVEATDRGAPSYTQLRRYEGTSEPSSTCLRRSLASTTAASSA